MREELTLFPLPERVEEEKDAPARVWIEEDEYYIHLILENGIHKGVPQQHEIIRIHKAYYELALFLEDKARGYIGSCYNVRLTPSKPPSNSPR